jgi:hypothetical protein
MTSRVVADGVVAGCVVAALQASELGRRIYERLGFRTVVRYVAFVDPVFSVFPATASSASAGSSVTT